MVYNLHMNLFSSDFRRDKKRYALKIIEKEKCRGKVNVVNNISKNGKN